MLLILFFTSQTAQATTINCPAALPAAARVTCLLNATQTALTAAEERISALEVENDELRQYLSVDESTDSVVFSGANVYVQNGLAFDSVNGLGNLVIGELGYGSLTGSHNLWIGTDHTMTSYAGLVAGWQNTVSAPFCSVTGGAENEAGGYPYAVVGGGNQNLASGPYSVVAGGSSNEASGGYGVVLAGRNNLASSYYTSVTGGNGNEAGDAYEVCPLE